LQEKLSEEGKIGRKTVRGVTRKKHVRGGYKILFCFRGGKETTRFCPRVKKSQFCPRGVTENFLPPPSFFNGIALTVFWCMCLIGRLHTKYMIYKKSYIFIIFTLKYIHKYDMSHISTKYRNLNIRQSLLSQSCNLN